MGHNSTLRKKPTVEGFTHDWEIFLRPIDGSTDLHLKKYIKRVEFHLHPSFARSTKGLGLSNIFQ